ncbi:Protein CBG27658 [Caenorhabditis briggsae]|uniref:Protein CBG27658 n=1 Tax=Caenorhabditis briggsae TaxID=6238 RepID=B6IJA3_CAEBR|nr:Protein CBG27658 [Caenorhabditis briggsae]CAR99937.1 Protein CBG27658 [Caenorhabditis briggsae]
MRIYLLTTKRRGPCQISFDSTRMLTSMQQESYKNHKIGLPLESSHHKPIKVQHPHQPLNTQNTHHVKIAAPQQLSSNQTVHENQLISYTASNTQHLTWNSNLPRTHMSSSINGKGYQPTTEFVQTPAPMMFNKRDANSSTMRLYQNHDAQKKITNHWSMVWSEQLLEEFIKIPPKKNSAEKMAKFVSEFRVKHHIVTGQDKVLGLFKKHIQDVLSGDEVSVGMKVGILNKWRTAVTPNVRTLSLHSNSADLPSLDSNHMQVSRSNEFCPSRNVPVAKMSSLQSFQQKHHPILDNTRPGYIPDLDNPELFADSLLTDDTRIVYVKISDESTGGHETDGYEKRYAVKNGNKCNQEFISDDYQSPQQVHESYGIQEESISPNFNGATTPNGPHCSFSLSGDPTVYEWFPTPGTDSSPLTTPRCEAYNPTSSYANSLTDSYSSQFASLVDQFSPGELGFESVDIEIKPNDYQNVSHEYDQDLIVD